MKPIPENLELPEINEFVLIFFKQLPDAGPHEICHSVGFFNGRKFFSQAHKDSHPSLLRYVVGWEEITVSPQTAVTLKLLKNHDPA
jgi:hypothetical protein